MENEKINKTKVLAAILIVLAMLVIGMTVEADLMKNQQSNNSVGESTHIEKVTSQMQLFTAEITFYLAVDDGCGCKPVPDVTILAIGESSGAEEGTTDEDGMVIIPMEINEPYWVTIDGDGYQEIKYEFEVIDDQTFTFLLDKIDESSREVSRTPKFVSLLKTLRTILLK